MHERRRKNPPLCFSFSAPHFFTHHDRQEANRSFFFSHSAIEAPQKSCEIATDEWELIGFVVKTWVWWDVDSSRNFFFVFGVNLSDSFASWGDQARLHPQCGARLPFSPTRWAAFRGSGAVLLLKTFCDMFVLNDSPQTPLPHRLQHPAALFFQRVS